MSDKHSLAENCNVKPWCAVCHRPVDFVRCDYDPLFRKFHFIVRCHGAYQECDVPEIMLVNAKGVIEPGVAFDGPTVTRLRADQERRRIDGKPDVPV